VQRAERYYRRKQELLINTLKKNKEFNFVYRRGNPRSARHLVAVVAKSNYGGIRAGFSVSKKIGKSVVRNKVRRRLKEAFRELTPRINGNYCIIFIARSSSRTRRTRKYRKKCDIY
jgi:ribonuclease P protein component